jgi:hypothetical protein
MIIKTRDFSSGISGFLLGRNYQKSLLKEVQECIMSLTEQGISYIIRKILCLHKGK